MATRAQKYGMTYVPALRMAIRWEEIQANIEKEQDRYKAAMEVVARERAELSDLSARLEAEPPSAEVLASYLVAIGADTQAAARARVGATQAVTEKEKSLEAIVAKRGEGPATDTQVEKFREAVKTGVRLSPDTIKSVARALDISEAEQNSLLEANAKLKSAGGGKPGPSAKTIEGGMLLKLTDPSAAARPAMQGTLEARGLTPAKSAPALTEAQVLKAYTRALSGGTGGDLAGRFASAIGPLPEKTDPAALLAEAGQLYDRTRTEGSFSREDAKVFNDDWLRTAEALRSAEETAEEIKPGYTDPAREAARREIIARGLDPDDKYLALKGDRRYDYLKKMERLLDETDRQVKPVTPEELKIAEFVSMLQRESARTGQPLELKALEKQLGKVYKGQALIDAMGFGLALGASQQPAPPKNRAEIQREAAVSAERLKEIDAARAAAKLEQERVESALQAEIESLTRQAAETAATQGQLTQVVTTPVRRTGAEIEADARRQARREDRFGIVPAPRTALRSRGSLEAELFPPAEGPRTVTLSSGPGREVPPPASPFDPLQVPSLDQRATETVVRSLREGGDLRTNALRLRALGYSNEQIRALVAAARSVPTVEVPPEPAKPPGEFIDWSDPNKTVYRRDPATGVLYGPDGKAITSQRAMAALGVVEAGDTPENRAKLAKIQAGASTPKPSNKEQTGVGTAPNEDIIEGRPGGSSATPVPGAPGSAAASGANPFARLPGESAEDYKKRLRGGI